MPVYYSNLTSLSLSIYLIQFRVTSLPNLSTSICPSLCNVCLLLDPKLSILIATCFSALPNLSILIYPIKSYVCCLVPRVIIKEIKIKKWKRRDKKREGKKKKRESREDITVERLNLYGGKISYD